MASMTGSKLFVKTQALAPPSYLDHQRRLFQRSLRIGKFTLPTPSSAIPLRAVAATPSGTSIPLFPLSLPSIALPDIPLASTK